MKRTHAEAAEDTRNEPPVGIRDALRPHPDCHALLDRGWRVWHRPDYSRHAEAAREHAQRRACEDAQHDGLGVDVATQLLPYCSYVLWLLFNHKRY